MADLPQKLSIGASEAWESARSRMNQFASGLDTWIRGEPRWKSFDIEWKGGQTNIEVRTGVTGTPKGAWVESIREKNADAVPTAAWSFHWRPSKNGFEIRSIPGLTSDTLYLLRVLVRWG